MDAVDSILTGEPGSSEHNPADLYFRGYPTVTSQTAEWLRTSKVSDGLLCIIADVDATGSAPLVIGGAWAGCSSPFMLKSLSRVIGSIKWQTASRTLAVHQEHHQHTRKLQHTVGRHGTRERGSGSGQAWKSESSALSR